MLNIKIVSTTFILNLPFKELVKWIVKLFPNQ